MGALGGDISTIGTNPAGIGIYRSNDAMLTFGDVYKRQGPIQYFGPTEVCDQATKTLQLEQAK